MLARRASIGRMAALHIRNVSDETVTALKRRAADNGRSLEAELRAILDAEVERPRRRRPRKLNLVLVDSGNAGGWDRDEFYE